MNDMGIADVADELLGIGLKHSKYSYFLAILPKFSCIFFINRLFIVSSMKKIDEHQFFSQYPMYKNLDELKKADLLIMPLHNNKSFWGAQRDFFSLTQNQDFNCRFFTENRNSIPFYAEFSAPPPDVIINFGISVISTISGLIGIYQFLKERTQGQKFKIKHIISIKDGYYELDEFEGTLTDYQRLHKEMELQFKK